jgi:hypothetical protein
MYLRSVCTATHCIIEAQRPMANALTGGMYRYVLLQETTHKNDQHGPTKCPLRNQHKWRLKESKQYEDCSKTGTTRSMRPVAATLLLGTGAAIVPGAAFVVAVEAGGAVVPGAGAGVRAEERVLVWARGNAGSGAVGEVDEESRGLPVNGTYH